MRSCSAISFGVVSLALGALFAFILENVAFYETYDAEKREKTDNDPSYNIARVADPLGGTLTILRASKFALFHPNFHPVSILVLTECHAGVLNLICVQPTDVKIYVLLLGHGLR